MRAWSSAAILAGSLAGCFITADEDLWRTAKDSHPEGTSQDQMVADAAADGNTPATDQGDGPRALNDLYGEATPSLDLRRDVRTDGRAADLAGDKGACIAETFECVSGSARVCSAGTWTALGFCPLGCVESSKSCYTPSNVSIAHIKGTGDLDLTGKGTVININADTGEITGIRPAGAGLNATTGIYFAHQSQAGGAELGVFSIKKLVVPQNTTLRGIGARGLVLLTTVATIGGVIEVSAAAQPGGPGGFNGGDAGLAGKGTGGGKPGTGQSGSEYCDSGSGGGGYGTAGAAGGSSTCASPSNFAGGAAGVANGTAAMMPLIGGSGGAGGSFASGATDPVSSPGPGGGGGGAVQVTATTSIAIGPKGGINAGGAGGAGCTSAGGSGGGSGGGILLEAPTVSVAVGGVLAANGGGGGAGDCT